MYIEVTMSKEQHDASGKHLLAQFYIATVKVYNQLEAMGKAPDGVKEELDAIGLVYDTCNPYDKAIANRLKAVSSKLRTLPTSH